MKRWLSIAAYTCQVGNTKSQGIDFRVRQFDFNTEHEVESFLETEPPQTYLNGDGEEVRWTLARIYAIQEYQPSSHGDELIGFISSLEAIHEDLA